MSVGARLRQFLAAGATPGEDDLALARSWLDGQLLTLFFAQHPRDIVHSAGTARWLLDRGHDSRDVIEAALLHDIAKGEQRRADRIAYVLAGRAGLARKLAAPGSRRALRRAVARSVTHAGVGAAQLVVAGAGERVVELTRLHHAAAGGDPVVALLQQADAAN